METFQQFRYYTFSTKLALFFFFVGTLLFASYFILPDNDGIIIIGLFFVIFAVFLNSVVLFYLFVQFLLHPPDRQHTFIRILIVLANIPVAILYFYLIIHSFRSQHLY